MLAEVFAGRIGSPLDPGVSLYELDPTNGSLVFIAGNNNTLNPTQGTDGSIPLFTDSALVAGLTAGDYYLAVADGSNTPSPLEGQMPGTPGLFDPDQPGSAQLGWSTGAYVLNLLVEPARESPLVVASSPSSGQVLDQAPTQLTVQFSEPINIQQLAYEAFASQESGDAHPGLHRRPRRHNVLSAIPVLQSHHERGHVPDARRPDQWLVRASPLGNGRPDRPRRQPDRWERPERRLCDSISGRGINARDRRQHDRRLFTLTRRPNQGVPQDLGVLFPRELQAGVTVVRGPDSGTSPDPGTTQDDYVDPAPPEPELFVHARAATDLPSDAQVTVQDSSGTAFHYCRRAMAWSFSARWSREPTPFPWGAGPRMHPQPFPTA